MKTDSEDDRVHDDDISTLGAFEMTSVRADDIHTIRLEGELDLAHADKVERELRDCEATDARAIVLDLSGLTFMDSTGIRLVLQAQARSQQDANRLALVRGPESVQRVFRIAGIEDMLPFAD